MGLMYDVLRANGKDAGDIGNIARVVKGHQSHRILEGHRLGRSRSIAIAAWAGPLGRGYCLTTDGI
jgi:hypothetical protein